MTVTISVWAIPTILTIAFWLAAFFWPSETRGGNDFGIGAAIGALVRLCAALAATLLVWLIFFICLFIVGN